MTNNTTETDKQEVYDILIYGDSSAGVAAGIQAGRLGKSVVIISPLERVGGLTVSGLGWTDLGDKRVIGGLSREFYRRVWDHYQKEDAWTWERREEFIEPGDRWDETEKMASVFEPSVAEAIYEEMLAEASVSVHRNQWLNREDGVEMDGDRIVSITTLDGTTYHGKIFIDATYEGDLMAAAGVNYRVGREGTDEFDEEWAGVQKDEFHHRHNFQVLDKTIDPYVEPGNPESGLLDRVQPEHPGPNGTGDEKIQAYCFRMCLTDADENRIPFPKPEGYDPDQYELLVRIYEAGWREQFEKFDPVPNRKTDVNNHGPFSTDNIGCNWEYPEASYEKRREIVEEHERYQKGLMYFIANDPQVPNEIQEEMQQWGLPKDEFVDNDHWPDQLYIREARRMVSKYVMTEHDVLGRVDTPEPIGMGAYTMDSHHVQRYIRDNGSVENEGDMGIKVPEPYSISYGTITPKKDQCENLLVTAAVSSTHIAFGSIRMEPVFMVLGQSAAVAAAMAINNGISVQEVPYQSLRKKLLKKGQVLTLEEAT